jgi:hypothetical protein
VARKSVAQLTKEVINLSDDLKTLNTQLGALTKGSSAWANTLLKVQKQQEAVAKSQDNLAVSAQKLNKSYPRNTKLINDATAALEKSNRVYNKSSSLLNAVAKQNERIAELEKKLESYRRKLRENSNKMAQDIEKARIKYIENLEIQSFQNRINKEKALKKERERLAKEAEDAEKARIKRIENFELQAFKSKVNRLKREAREQKKIADEQAREAKKNDFGGAFAGSFTPQKLGSTLGTITRFLGIGTAVFTAINALKQLTIESFKTFARLEQSFANLGAVSNASSQQMNKLRDSAFEVASQTGYAADEVIQLQTSLVKLGVSTDDVIESTGIVAISARALGEDLSSVGELIFKISNQYGLSGQEISTTSATLVRAINESALTFQDFGTAIQYVGPIANNVGLTFEQTAGFMEILSNAGFKASKIGTGLRDIFADIKVPGESLVDTISRLSKENIGFAEALDLVGKTSVAQFLTLLRNGDLIEELGDKTAIAAKQQENLSMLLVQNSKQLNTTEGRLGMIAQAWEAYSFRIGEAITSTETFIRVIDLLDRKTAQQARSASAIAGMSQGRVNQAVTQTIGAGSSRRAAFELLSPQDQKRINDYARFRQITTEEYLKGLLSGDISRSEKEIQTYIGLARQIADLAQQQVDAQGAANIKVQEGARYKKQLLDIEKAEGINKAKLVVQLQATLDNNEKILKKRKESFKDDSKEAEIIDLRIDAIKALRDETNNLLEFETESDLAKNKKAQDKSAEDAQKRELDRLKDLIELRKREYNEKVESLKIELELAKVTGNSKLILEKEIELLKLRSESAKELTNAINSSKLIGPEQKFDLLGSFGVFNVNEEDIVASVNRISSTFQETIASKGIFQAEIIGKQLIQQFIDSLGDSITPEQRTQIQDLFNALFYGNGSTDLKTRKGDGGGKSGIGSDDFEKELLELAKDAAGALQESIEAIRNTAFENLMGQLDAEKEAVQERYDFEEKALRGQLEGQLVTQEEYEKKLENIKRKRIIKENAIDKKIFEAEKKRDKQNASLAFVESLASLAINNFKKFDTAAALVLTSIGTAIASAQYAVQLSSINQRQFFPTRFAQGGVVNGPSHAEGGVPFTVQGRGGYEMEGGEFIVNKEATKRNYSLLRQINDSVKPSSYSSGRIFAAGGIVKAEELGVRQLQLLESIAMATGGTYKNTSKPVRAFVSADDLRKSDVDLRIKERNSNL